MNTLANDIERIVKDGIFIDVKGEMFSATKLLKVSDDRCPEPITLKTLKGLCDYIGTNVDGLKTEHLLIIVHSPDSVSLCQGIDPTNQKRFNFVNVRLDKSGKDFPYGQFIDSEAFIIKLQSMFQEDGDIKELRAFLSKLAVNETIQTNDDGISQDVVVKKGMSGALKESQTAPAIVNLTPNRTFAEVVQPQSKFLFRMKATDNKLPLCALFEADGGAWQNVAMKNIEYWLGNNAGEISIIA